MPASQTQYQNFTAANVPTANSAETLQITSRAVSSAYAGSSFGIRFACAYAAGASTTSYTLRIRRDSLTGTVVATWTGLTEAAAGFLPISVEVVDTLVGESTGQLWVLTLAQVAGTAPGGTVNNFSAITVPV